VKASEFRAALLRGDTASILQACVLFLDENGATHVGHDSVLEAFGGRPDFFGGFRFADEDACATVRGFNGDGLAVKLSLHEGVVDRIFARRPDPDKKRIRIVVTYDGTDFFGFQRQLELRTVQAELEAAVARINDAPTAVNGASRTDTGVHARGQTAHFDTFRDFDGERWKTILNHQLPDDIRIVTADVAHPLFHARYDTWEKEYRYVLDDGEYDPLLRNFRWYCGPFDEVVLGRELAKIVGTHDFTSFAKGEKESKVRTIREVRVEREGSACVLVFVGDGFLHNMIRLIVATAVGIARGEIAADMTEILIERNRERTQELAPPGGLTLVRIDY
jgi:tRNA pseudouridine38-40 synthase